MLCRQSPQRRRRVCTLCEAKTIRVENVLSPSTCSTRASPSNMGSRKGGFRVWKLPTPHLHWCWLSIPVEAGTEPSWLADVSMSVNSTCQVSLQASLPRLSSIRTTVRTNCSRQAVGRVSVAHAHQDMFSIQLIQPSNHPTIQCLDQEHFFRAS